MLSRSTMSVGKATTYTLPGFSGENLRALWLTRTHSCSPPLCWESQQHSLLGIFSPTALHTQFPPVCLTPLEYLLYHAQQHCLKQSNITGLIILPLNFPQFQSASKALFPPFMTFNSAFLILRSLHRLQYHIKNFS